MKKQNILNEITDKISAGAFGSSKFYWFSGLKQSWKYLTPKALFLAACTFYIALALTLLKDRSFGGRMGVDVIITDMQKQYAYGNGLTGTIAIIITFWLSLSILKISGRLFKFDNEEKAIFINTAFVFMASAIFLLCAMVLFIYFFEDVLSIEFYKRNILTISGRDSILWFNHLNYQLFEYILPSTLFCWVIVKVLPHNRQIYKYLLGLLLVIFSTDLLDGVYRCCRLITHPEKETIFLKGSIGPDALTGSQSDRIKFRVVNDTLTRITHIHIDLFIYNNGSETEIIPKSDSLYLRIASKKELLELTHGIHPDAPEWGQFKPKDRMAIGVSQFDSDNDKYMVIEPHKIKCVTFTVDVPLGTSMFMRPVAFLADTRVKVARLRVYRPSGNYRIDPQAWLYHDVVQSISFEIYHPQ